MEAQTFEAGNRVRFEGEPFSEGVVVKVSPSGGGSVLVSWDNGNRTWEWAHDLAKIA